MSATGSPRPLDDRLLGHLREVAEIPDLTGTRYEMIGFLERGGMGTVYAVRDTLLGRDAALKILNAPDPSGDLAARLAAEARHLASLEHPNIVPVHDAGRLADGRVFYVMKLVRGTRLDRWRAERPARSAKLRLFQKVCGAVAFAHDRGVIHRDLKPENIMVGPFGEALVMDWGVAKRLDSADEADEARTLAPGAGSALSRSGGATRTMPGAVLGTPAYMAPEQARGDVARLGPRTDVHALGAILHFLLSGRPPFEAPEAAAILDRVIRHQPASLRAADRRIPRALESICLKAMAKDPEDRYAGAQEMSDDVDRFLDGLPVLAHRETILERGGRLAARHKALLLLVAAYLIMRVMVLAFAGR